MTKVMHPHISRVDFGSTKNTRKNSEPSWTSSPVHPKSSDRIRARTYDQQESTDPDLDDVVRELFHLTLASLRGYREILHLTTHPELHNLVTVLVQQRSAQCRALAQMSQSLYRQLARIGAEDDSLSDPSAAELQIVWLRTIWSFEQDELGRFVDNIEQAETILEDAFLTTANMFRTTAAAAIFQQFALTICGARQRLDELSENLVHAH